MVDEQKKQLLALRSDHDQIAVYQRDVDAAQRAYDAVAQRLSQLNLEGQNNQANTRLLSPAVEPLEPSRPKILLGIVGSILGGLAAGMRWRRFGSRLLDRRVRVPEDLIVMAGVPVIGVLRPAGSKRPVFRRLLMVGRAAAPRPALAAPGSALMKTAVSMLGTAAARHAHARRDPDRRRPAQAGRRRARPAITRSSTTCASARRRFASA